jgi:DNA (cytosine-5)-methyltransferase 1
VRPETGKSEIRQETRSEEAGVRQLTHGSLFAGIGGFDLGFERAGIQTEWQVEIDGFCQRILAKHFPEATRYDDVRRVHGWDHCGKIGIMDAIACGNCLSPVDIITGGFPCQPFSCSGKRSGKADSRFLWPEMLRVIQECRPSFVVGENVGGLVDNWGGSVLDEIYASLESSGYEVLPPLIVPACAFGAPHRRDRVWILAHSLLGGRSSEHEKQQTERPSLTGPGGSRGVADPKLRKPEVGRHDAGVGRERKPDTEIDYWESEAQPRVGGVVDGIPHRMDRLRALGNAIVPQIAEWIGRRIVEASNQVS